MYFTCVMQAITRITKYEMMPNLPARMVCVASSAGGISSLIQKLVREKYRFFLREYTWHMKSSQAVSSWCNEGGCLPCEESTRLHSSL